MTVTKAQNSHAAQGFTLIELLAALLLFGLVAVALGEGMRFGARAWERQDKTLVDSTDLDAVQRFLRQTIDLGYLLHGDANHLALTAPLPEAFAGGGLFDVSLRLDGQHLVLDWRHRAEPGKPVTPYRQTKLLTGVAGLRIGYLIDDSHGIEWHDELTKPSPSLSLIKIDITFAPPDHRRWPSLLAAPRQALVSPANSLGL